MKDWEKQQIENKWYRDPENWIWDTLYFNKFDERVFIPNKSSNKGFTINFGSLNFVRIVLLIIKAFIIVGFLHLA